MYSESDVKRLQTRSLALIGNVDNLSANDIEPLREVLQFHENRYYVQNDPLLADGEYDLLYKKLVAIEAANPSLINAQSPTQRVGASLIKSFETVQHLVPMLSLDNGTAAGDLIDFDRKARELSHLAEIEYCVEPKFDGASISLIYENDILVRAATRGDGIAGDEITLNARQIKTIPLSAKFSAYGIQQIEIRGEVLMSKSNFAAYNSGMVEKGLAPLANPRNAASGSLRIKDSKEVAKRNLEAFAYHVSYFTLLPGWNERQPFLKHSQSLQMLWQLGFRSPDKEKKICNGIQQVIDYCIQFETERDKLPYEIDGLVIKVNDLNQQEQLGSTTHHPRWAMAYKFKARQATSELVAVEFQVGRTGSITPVGKILPVPLGGVTVSSFSLFNEEVIREKNLMIGDKVLVERAGDVIPYIVKSFAELRSGNEQPIVFPTECPACKSPLYKEQEEAVWRCINIECPAQVVEKIIHFASKDAMDIRGFGDAIVKRFFEKGLLKDIPGIYQLDFEKIAQLDGFGEKSRQNLQTAIEQSKGKALHRLIFGLGIRFVGETTAKTLSNSVSHLLDFVNFKEEDLLKLEDVGPKVAQSILHFFSTEANIITLRELEALGLKLSNEKSETTTDGNLAGLTFLFTGTLPTLKRSEAEAMAEEKGGKIVAGVSAKLNYLVVGEDAGSKLEKAKKLHTVKIISEEEFLVLIQDK